MEAAGGKATLEERVGALRAQFPELDPPERPVDEHEGWSFGERVRVVEDDEEEGVFAGDEGVLVLETVGGVEYGNERVGLFLACEGRTGAVEVQPDNIEAA